MEENRHKEMKALKDEIRALQVSSICGYPSIVYTYINFISPHVQLAKYNLAKKVEDQASIVLSQARPLHTPCMVWYRRDSYRCRVCLARAF